MAKMAIVVAFELPEDEQEGFQKSSEMLQKLKPMFEDVKDVQVFGAIKETANTIIDILKLGA